MRMHLVTSLLIALALITASCSLKESSNGPERAGAESSSSTGTTADVGDTASADYSTFQSPYLAPNDDSNIHQNSFFTDVFTRPGPTDSSDFTSDYLNNWAFQLQKSDGSKTPTFIRITECASVQFDPDNNLAIGVCGSIPNIWEETMKLNLMAFDLDTYKVRGYADLGSVQYTKPISQDFGIGAYSYIDQNMRPVIVGSDCHIRIYDAPNIASNSGDDNVAVEYEVIADWNICNPSKDPKPPIIDPDDFKNGLNLYATLPDKYGNIWFSVQQGLVGYIAGAGDAQNQNDANNAEILTLDLWPDDNDDSKPKEVIVNSNSLSQEGKAHFLGSINMYQFQAGDKEVQKNWEYKYDNEGGNPKPGQVSAGGGSSPSIFFHEGAEYVTFTDNATDMQVVVLDVETGQEAMKEVAFPGQDKTANENSLIAWTVNNEDNSAETWIYVENNYGNSFCTVMGEGQTQPGFTRFVFQNGKVNDDKTLYNTEITIPSVVSQGSAGSSGVYTWNKEKDGWYFTGIQPNDLNTNLFTSKASEMPVNQHSPPQLTDTTHPTPSGYGINLTPTSVKESVAYATAEGPCQQQITSNLDKPEMMYNNSYSAIILAPTSKDGKNRVWVGLAFGMFVITY